MFSLVRRRGRLDFAPGPLVYDDCARLDGGGGGEDLCCAGKTVEEEGI